MSWSNRCEMCPGEPPPPESAVWRLDRVGDAVISWACNEHLPAVLEGLQRGHEVTEVVVRSRARIEEMRDDGSLDRPRGSSIHSMRGH